MSSKHVTVMEVPGRFHRFITSASTLRAAIEGEGIEIGDERIFLDGREVRRDINLPDKEEVEVLIFRPAEAPSHMIAHLPEPAATLQVEQARFWGLPVLSFLTTRGTALISPVSSTQELQSYLRWETEYLGPSEFAGAYYVTLTFRKPW